jgi:hypothetical protein
MQLYLVHTRPILSPYPSHVDPSRLCVGLEDTQCLHGAVEDDRHVEVTESASDEVEDKQERARKTLEYLKK